MKFKNILHLMILSIMLFSTISIVYADSTTGATKVSGIWANGDQGNINEYFTLYVIINGTSTPFWCPLSTNISTSKMQRLLAIAMFAWQNNKTIQIWYNNEALPGGAGMGNVISQIMISN